MGNDGTKRRLKGNGGLASVSLKRPQLNDLTSKMQPIPIVIGALGSVIKRFKGYVEQLKCEVQIEALQRTCLLGTARILRKVLDTK